MFIMRYAYDNNILASGEIGGHKTIRRCKHNG